MSAATDDPERRARIDLMLLDIELRIEQIAATRGQIGQIAADSDRKRQEVRLAPWALAIGGMGTGAALFAAAFAFAKLFT
jgi:hypothetical protein